MIYEKEDYFDAELMHVVMETIDWIVIAACAVAALRYAPELIVYGWYTGKLRAHENQELLANNE